MDLNLPGASGFSALVHVRAQYPSIPIIVVSAHEETSIIQRAIAHGAMGYIPKSAHPSPIGEAIRQVLEGDIWLPPNLPANLNFDPRAADETALAERIQFLPWLDPERFYSLILQADVVLDSFHFGGGSTSRGRRTSCRGCRSRGPASPRRDRGTPSR